MITQWRQKLVNQVTVRGVDFDNAKTGIACATRRGGKSGNDVLNPIERERFRHRVILGERNGAWRHHIAPTAFHFCNGSRAFPRPTRARLASSVRQLHSGDTTLLVNEAD